MRSKRAIVTYDIQSYLGRVVTSRQQRHKDSTFGRGGTKGKMTSGKERRAPMRGNFEERGKSVLHLIK